ncbi:MAG: arylsulfatase [Spirosomataceae bacterium]
MKKLLFYFLPVWVLAQPKKTAERPNIIVILADDMGFSDIGCFGGEIPTPHLDRLAAKGIRMNNFYNTGRCCPSRAALLTGVYPQEAGVGYMVEPVENNPAYQGYLNRETVTFAEAMKEAGYFTAIAGKWHVGHEAGQGPHERGFMRSLAAPVGGFMYTGQPRAQIFLNGKPAKAGVDIPKDYYVTDLWTDYGMKFIEEAQAEQKPFLLYLAHNAPHFPLQAPAEDIARFKGKYLAGWEKLRAERYERQMKMNLLGKKYDLPPINPKVPAWESLSPAEKERYDTMMAIYAAMVSHLDESIGKLVKNLEDKGLLENTLLLFFSDNGGNAESGVKGITQGDTLGNRNSNVFLGQCWAELNNTPLWLYKHHTSEGGIASPFIAHWPKGIATQWQGKIIDEPAHLVDIMPTLLALGGATYPTAYQGHTIKPQRGISLVPVFSGKKLSRTQPLFWEHEGNRAIRIGDWKAVSNLTEPWQLYNMKADRTELNDLSAAKPDMLKDLLSKYDRWYESAGAKPYFKEPMKWQSSIIETLKNTKK